MRWRRCLSENWRNTNGVPHPRIVARSTQPIANRQRQPIANGGTPIQQYCYYTTPSIDHSSKRVDIASNRVRSPNVDPGLVPDLEGALAKCQWWQA
jgi:hypothetical protein